MMDSASKVFGGSCFLWLGVLLIIFWCLFLLVDVGLLAFWVL